ncbi:hypothetical protein [Oceanobacillus senegalensis]|nr:hypothetical protein [Oceanobacillus senegalensis]
MTSIFIDLGFTDFLLISFIIVTYYKQNYTFISNRLKLKLDTKKEE